MKSIRLVLISLGILMLVTGCGGNENKLGNEEKLECTRSNSSGSIITKDILSYDNNDKLISITRESVYDKSQYSGYKYFEDELKSKQDEAEKLGIGFKVDRKDDSITIVYTYTGDAIDEFDAKAVIGKKPNEAKSVYENAGATCK